VRFRVVVYSATNPQFRSEHVHECALTDLPNEATSSAKEIAATVGVPVSRAIRFDSHKIDPEALRTFDESLSLAVSVESDISDLLAQVRPACSESKNPVSGEPNVVRVGSVIFGL